MLSGLLARAGLVTPEQRAWAWYDWANSVYWTTVITAVFPSFFATYAAAGLAPAAATARFSAITTASMAVIAISAPILGALADRTGRRKRLMAIFLAIALVSCASMVFIGEGAIALAAGLFFLSNVGASGSLVFYDSLLPHVARPDQMDRVSSAGYALGYISGGLVLLLNLAWIMQPATVGFGSTTMAVKASFLSVAVWWGVFSIPLFRRVPEPPASVLPDEIAGQSSLVAAFARLAHTFQAIRRYRQAFLFFIATLLYQDGIQTIIRMAGVYGAEIGIDQTSQIMAFVMVQFLGIPFAFLFGYLGSRIGTKRAIFIAIAVYAAATVLGYFMTTAAHFFMLAGLVATVQGGA
ncbi:MAG: MFS transporter, partial [Acidobacteria bacterium]|nr:MFS transporter [Acidobacteriota bacterium]